MKNLTIALRALFGVAGLAALCATTPASAIPITDSVDPADTLITFGSTQSCPSAFFTCTTSALSFAFEITDNGFVVGLDTINSATIAIHLTETATAGANESYQFDIGAGPQTFTSVNVPGGNGSTDTITLNDASLADLAADGIISVKVSSTDGTFLFADSLLTVQVTQVTELLPRTNEVPEPSTPLLLGAGLAALGSRFRRRS